jgi:hypothetical protein
MKVWRFEMTPNFAVIRIQPGHGWWPPFPLPLFLLWIPGILLAPFILVAIWVPCLVFELPFWHTLRAFWDILCSLPGTHVRVCAEGKKITVRIL